MKYTNFHKLFDGFDVSPILNEIAANGNAWQKRKNRPKPWHIGYTHRYIEGIALRLTEIPPDSDVNMASYEFASNQIVAEDLPIYDKYPSTREVVYKVMRQIRGGMIGRVSLFKLPPGKSIDGHYDTGFGSKFYHRFHLIVNGERGNWISCGEGEDEEHLEMLTGECWTFNHEKWHYFTNRSNADRIYLNIDIR